MNRGWFVPRCVLSQQRGAAEGGKKTQWRNLTAGKESRGGGPAPLWPSLFLFHFHTLLRSLSDFLNLSYLSDFSSRQIIPKLSIHVLSFSPFLRHFVVFLSAFISTFTNFYILLSSPLFLSPISLVCSCSPFILGRFFFFLYHTCSFWQRVKTTDLFLLSLCGFRGKCLSV